MSNEVSTEISIIELLLLLKKHLVAIILVAVLFGVGAFYYSSYMISPVYATSATVLVKSTSMVSDNSSSVLNDLYASQRLAASYTIVLTSETAMESVLEKTNLNYSPAQLRGMVSISVVNDSEILRIGVVGTNPNDIVVIANALLEVAPDLLQKIVEAGSVNTVDVAKYSGQIGPSVSKNVTVAFLIGAIITAVIVILIGIFDKTIKDEDEISAIYNINVLGCVPSFENTKNGGRKNG